MVGGKEQANSEIKTIVSMHAWSTELPISKLWDLDTIGIMDPVEQKSKKEVEEETKQHFLSSVSRDPDGRYSVKLRWIEEAPVLPTNRKHAESRLIGSKIKLSSSDTGVSCLGSMTVHSF